MTEETRGRPTVYTNELIENICQRLADGESLNSITKEADMPSRNTLYRWLKEERYALFRDKYESARLEQADKFFEQIIEIADDDSLDIGFTEEGKPFIKGENIQRSRLRIDARKWVIAKMIPKKYGDKIEEAYEDKVININIAGVKVDE